MTEDEGEYEYHLSDYVPLGVYMTADTQIIKEPWVFVGLDGSNGVSIFPINAGERITANGGTFVPQQFERKPVRVLSDAEVRSMCESEKLSEEILKRRDNFFRYVPGKDS
jgi:hypothetical protein